MENVLKPDKKHLTRSDWADDVKGSINSFLDAYNADTAMYAVFDFDNTITVFDIEDQMLEFQIETMAFAIKPDEMERVMLAGAEDCGSLFAKAAGDAARAYNTLWERYGGFCPCGVGEEKKTVIQDDPYWIEFNVKMIYLFKTAYRELAPEAADQWMLHRFYGMRAEEIYDLALKTAAQNSGIETRSRTWESPAQIDSEAGCLKVTWVYGISVSENMRELTEVLASNGVDVWICSASDVDAVRAGVDHFGIHENIRGVLGMTPEMDPEGRCTTAYDLKTGCGYYSLPGGGWEKMQRSTRAVTCQYGKVEAIRNAIAPEYDGRGPVAGFMDSEGDYAFCTEFDSIRLVLCINRADRSPEDGGSIMAIKALCRNEEKEKSSFGALDNIEKEHVIYLLQGRNEQGMRHFWNSQKTLLFGADRAVLFTDKRTCASLIKARQEAGLTDQ